MIISIINHKGGVGKTATTVNLGHALARLGKMVLIIDIDPQCNATSIILGSDEYRKSLYDLLTTDQNPKDFIHPTKYPNLFIIPNLPETATLEFDMVKTAPESLFELKKKLELIKNNYDFILIDNPPSLGVFCISSLNTSDYVIVPNEAGSRTSIEGLKRAVEFIEKIRNNSNPNLNFLKLLTTKVDKRLAVHKVLLKLIKTEFPQNKIFKTIIPVNTDIQKAELKKETIFKYKSNVSGAVAYKKLALELIESIN